MGTTERIPFHAHIFRLIDEIREQSTCRRRQVGAIAVRDKRILATGFNGAPSKAPHCTDLGFCLREQLKVPSGQMHELCYAVHAEQNVIIQAACNGIELRGSTLFCSTFPCSICAKMLINCKFDSIIYRDEYSTPESEIMVRELLLDKVSIFRYTPL